MLQPGDQIDIWVIERRLGSGGMGSVYRCHNRDANRILAAIKVLETHVAKSTEARRRFVREAEILFTLAHPNIVKVRNVRVEQETPYIEMEFVRGESIEDYLARSGAMPLHDTLPMMGQLANALAYLHSRGVRHRDIKPANLLVEDGTGAIKLVDFGLAMEADTTRLTQGTMSFGTVSYAPPEWVAPETLNPVLWDLYGVGVVFWEMLTGKVAFPVSGEGSARQQAFQVVLRKQNHEPLDPGPQFPQDLRDIVADLTKSDPSERLQSADELVKRLQNLDGMPDLPALPPQARPHTPQPTIIPRDGSSRTYQLGPGETQDLRPEITAAATLLEADIEPPASRPRGLGPLLVGIIVLLTLALIGATGVAAWSMWPAAEATRDVFVDIQGLADGLPADLAVGGRFPADRDGNHLRFANVPIGDHEVQWAVGEDCEAMACRRGQCPDWCLAGWRTIEVIGGDGPANIPFKLAGPAPRAVRVGVTRMAGDPQVAINVEGADGAMADGKWRASAVAPGKYRARIIIGECPQAAPCEEDCPPGCRDAVRELVVPAGQGTHEVTLPLAAPEAMPAVTTPEPKAPTNPGLSGPKPLVSNARYAKWLQGQPEWSRAAAQTNGRADKNYLLGWNGEQPAEGQGSRPVQYVPHLAARAFCQGRGGLPQVDDPPTSWKETGSGLSFEWRLKGDQPASLESTGQPSLMVRRAQSLLRTGFRCTK